MSSHRWPWLLISLSLSPFYSTRGIYVLTNQKLIKISLKFTSILKVEFPATRTVFRFPSEFELPGFHCISNLLGYLCFNQHTALRCPAHEWSLEEKPVTLSKFVKRSHENQAAGNCSFHSAVTVHSFFLYKNIFYKNIEAEICEILRIFEE